MEFSQPSARIKCWQTTVWRTTSTIKICTCHTQHIDIPTIHDISHSHYMLRAVSCWEMGGLVMALLGETAASTETTDCDCFISLEALDDLIKIL